jgi:hypothetical protein
MLKVLFHHNNAGKSKEKKIFALFSLRLVILQIWKAIGALLLFFLVVGI